MSKNRYNKVLWIIADEFRADCLRATGNSIVQTPNLDMLANEGVVMTNAFCQSSPCAPSRMCMFTGRYQCSTGVVDNMTPLTEARDTIATHLRHHGFTTAIAGYNDYAIDPSILPDGHPHKTSLSYDHFLPGFEVVLKHEYDSPEWYAWLNRQGYPDWACNREYMYTQNIPAEGPGNHLPLHYPARYKAEHSEGRFLTLKAIDYLCQHEKEDWVFSLNYIKPHGPYICPAPYHAMYNPNDMPVPIRRPEELSNTHPYISRCRNDWAQTELSNEQEWRELRACYYGMISELDACLGELFQYLTASGQWNSTLIIFTSDHGTYLGDHFLSGKPHFYDAAIHVPLIVRDPSPAADITRGKTLSGFVESIDLAPTICSFLGIPNHHRFQGRSFLEFVRGSDPSHMKQSIFYEFYYYNLLRNQTGVCPEECRLWLARDHHYKYVQFGEEAIPPQLFDLKNDPGEFDNLAYKPESAPLIAAYCQKLIRWRIRNEDYRMEQWARQFR